VCIFSNSAKILQKEWDELPLNLKNRLNAFCEKYGYEKIAKFLYKLSSDGIADLIRY
jgi:hypothetical protein